MCCWWWQCFFCCFVAPSHPACVCSGYAFQSPIAFAPGTQPCNCCLSKVKLPTLYPSLFFLAASAVKATCSTGSASPCTTAYIWQPLVGARYLYIYNISIRIYTQMILVWRKHPFLNSCFIPPQKKRGHSFQWALQNMDFNGLCSGRGSGSPVRSDVGGEP